VSVLRFRGTSSGTNAGFSLMLESVPNGFDTLTISIVSFEEVDVS
jgi:hypothetical protein